MHTIEDFINDSEVKKLVAINNRINIFTILGKDESETADTLFLAWLFEQDKGEKGFLRLFLHKAILENDSFNQIINNSDYYEVYT